MKEMESDYHGICSSYVVSPVHCGAQVEYVARIVM